MKAFFVHDVSQLLLFVRFVVLELWCWFILQLWTYFLSFFHAIGADSICLQIFLINLCFRFYLPAPTGLAFVPSSQNISSPPTFTVIVFIKPTAITQCSSFPTKRWWNDSEDVDAADAAADDCNGRLVSALSQLGPPPRARDLGKLQPRPDDALTAHEWFRESGRGWGREEWIYCLSLVISTFGTHFQTS